MNYLISDPVGSSRLGPTRMPKLPLGDGKMFQNLNRTERRKRRKNTENEMRMSE
jgi:hypothetical protein